MTELQNKLFSMQDLIYKDFNSSLIPTVPKDSFIGVRIPLIRKLANEFSKSDEAGGFLNSLPHKYYEENSLHSFVIEKIKDYDTAVYEVERFLPYIDNWATCDSFVPKAFLKNRQKLFGEIKRWINSSHTYTVRFGIGLMMKLYLDDEFKKEHLSLVASIKSDEYYVNMMIAWYFATALAKQYDAAIEYIKGNRLSIWCHNKTIQKSCESNRIDADVKKYLRTLKRK